MDDLNDQQDQAIDFLDISRRLGRGMAQILGMALLGVVIAAGVILVASRFQPISTGTRVVFSFPGFEKGQYPDGSKFEPDDLIAPDVVADAIKREGLADSDDFQAQVRVGLNVEGVIPADEVKARDRIRAAGEVLSPYIPNEYAITLTLKRSLPLSIDQRRLLMNAIVNTYREKFERTYADVPLAFGNAFETLKSADYFEYEMVLTEESQHITVFLNQQLDQAKNFRSSSTNLSFSDLLNQTDLFRQIKLDETLGLIRQNGLSKDRNLAMVKMGYYLATLEDQEQEALADEKTVQDLLSKAQEHLQSYVLGIKSELAQPRSEAPLLDQGLIDSLLANDSYNLLVRKALDAGLEVKRIQARKAQLLERRRDMQAFLGKSGASGRVIARQVDDSLGNLKVAYGELIKSIRDTQADFARQRFADAIRLSDKIKTEGMLKPLAEASGLGLFLGAALGAGLSLLGVYFGGGKES